MVAINKKVLKNNKGISLVDILIAIAVLAILITPIILQVTTTLETSAKAKEKQYVVDSATSVMEYFKQSSMTDIKTNKAASPSPGTINYKNEDLISSMDTSDSKKEVCHIFVDGSDTGATVDYNYYNVKLNKVKLGRAKNEYDRGVVISDLANRLLAGKASNGKRYRINYKVDLDKSSSAYTNIKSQSGFEFLSDHSAVKYTDDGDDTLRRIVAVDCVEVTGSDYSDPNSVSLGNIQNLNADTIAIIEGDATKLDHRFEEDVVSMILEESSRLKGTGKVNEDIFDTTEKLNEYIEDMIKQVGTVFNRMILVSVVRRQNLSNSKYYFHVDVKVRYYLSFTSTSTILNGKNTYENTYEVMNKDFYTTEPPDVYMVYEPFINNSKSKHTEYSLYDYISIQSDPYTSGKEINPETGANYDPSKIYLVKPKDTWQSVTGANNGLDPTSADYEKRKNMYLALDGLNYSPVKIVVNQYYGEVDTGSGTFEEYAPGDCYPLQIITNIATYHDDALGVDWIHNGIADPAHYDSTIADDSPEVQFVRSVDSSAKPSLTGDEKDRSAYQLGIPVADGASAGNYHFKNGDVTGDGVEDEQMYSIIPWQGESRYDGRVYNVTVMYKSPKGDVTYLTGAKGAD